MNEAAPLALVALADTCARHVIEKLRRELQRIESADDADCARDHVVNAFCTAWHVHQWMWDAISEKPDLKRAVLRYRGIEHQTIENHETFGAMLAGRFVPLKICRMIATSSRYVLVSSTAVQANMSVADPVANGRSVRSEPMIIVMGRPIAATRLLLEVDDYWVTMILDCGIGYGRTIDLGSFAGISQLSPQLAEPIPHRPQNNPFGSGGFVSAGLQLLDQFLLSHHAAFAGFCQSTQACQVVR